MVADVHPEIARLAFSRAEGNDFERFVNSFYPSLVGTEFQPLGGMHDGGADGFGGDPVHERVGKPTHFYQASVQQDSKAKIRHTVRRLKERGRDVRILTYVTSREVPSLDQVELMLTDELDVTVQIRDLNYLVGHLNDKPAGKSAFEHHLRHLTDYLAHIGKSSYLTESKYVEDPTIYVFLRQETDQDGSNGDLVASMTDTLIQWALEGTDPATSVFMKEGEILTKIVNVLPSARQQIEQNINHRLRMLSSKDYPGGRRIQYWTREDAYVLPYDARERIKYNNARDEVLAINVRRGFIQRAISIAQEGLDDADNDAMGDVAMRTIQILFEKQGLTFAHFLSSADPESAEQPNLADAAHEAIFEFGITGSKAVAFATVAVKIARETVYGSTADEREYLRKLSRTYTLLFTLRNDLKVVEYFQQLAAEFNLLVGSDMIIRAISERCLAEPDQLSRNTLKASAQLGMRLVLTEPVLDEVWWNLRNCDNEFRENYSSVEDSLTPEMIQNVPKILLRTYLYNRRRPGFPSNWPAFVGMLVDYKSLHSRTSHSSLRTYLMTAFGMDYLPRHEMQERTNPDDVVEISSQLKDIKKIDYLANNDALMACMVFAERHRLGEDKVVTRFGYHTWWLTSEHFILRTTKALMRKNNGARYMMRPEFLLNFLALAPSAEAVRTSYGHVFPTILGVNISRQMDEESFTSIIEKVKEAQDMEPARRVAVIEKLNNDIISNFSKDFGVSFEKVHRRPKNGRSGRSPS